jgi:hypothetical protein
MRNQWLLKALGLKEKAAKTHSYTEVAAQSNLHESKSSACSNNVSNRDRPWLDCKETVA